MLQGKRVVVIGTGWGGFSFVHALNLTGAKSLTIVSPRNYFLFTPLLPGVTVGTTEPRSIMDPIRTLVQAKQKKYPGVDIKFCEMEATNIDVTNNECIGEAAVSTPLVHGTQKVPYDVLVFSPGAQPASYGTPGVEENCYFLKEVSHARRIRNAIIDSFEAASLCTDPVERANLLHFVVVGGGPTGVEFSSELRDFMSDDLSLVYKDLVKTAKVTIIQAGDLLLNTYDKAISNYAEENFKRNDITILKNTAVIEVGAKTVTIENRMTKERTELPHGIVVWAAGVGPRPITANLIKNLGSPQAGAKLIKTDPTLKVMGSNNVYALGDCAMIAQPHLVQNSEKLFTEADVNKDGKLSREEVKKMITKLGKEYPLIDSQAATEVLDSMGNGSVGFDKAKWIEYLRKLELKFKSAPATAQVAQQQGEYLADLLMGKTKEPWKRVDRGMMSYVGSSRAVMQTQLTGAVTGIATFSLWRGAYASKLFSWRCRTYVVWDWLKKLLYGRDISRF